MKVQNPNLLRPKLWAIVPAAGSGRRFCASQLKQYQKIADKTVLEHSVSRLFHLPLAGLVIVVAPDDELAKTLDFSCADRVHFCHGGAERTDSVTNALAYLATMAAADDWVLVHDAARPCVSTQSLDALVSSALTAQRSAILAIAVRDTLKQAQGHCIERTVSRENLWQAQTPQIAPLGRLQHALWHAKQHQMITTDEASALEAVGDPVQIVAGDASNIKITYPEDLHLARLILASQAQ